MSYGIQKWGIGSWGGADFVVEDHFPIDNSINISRTPTISFILVSQSGNVTLSSINVIANGIAFITNGAFTSNAVGIIDNSNPASVIVTINTIQAFSPLVVVTIVISAINDSNVSLSDGTTWQFTVNSMLMIFQTYIVRKFERVINIKATGILTAPNNPHAVVSLDPPSNFIGVVI